MYRGKRFLITQPILYNFCGSTMVTIELARYLASEGADVTLYSCAYGEPVKSEIDNEFRVTGRGDYLSISDFDYIWVHSQILPPSIVEEFGKVDSDDKIPQFIFLHMSPLETIPDERPWIYNLERRLASSILVISESMREVMDWCYQDNSPVAIKFFRNPAPVCFSQADYHPNKDLKNILIVSNHPPKELIDAASYLKSSGCNVVVFGERGDSFAPITPDVLKKYDLVITIGKTVQYCLTMGVPVYIYDHFGGGGYINDENIELSRSYTFSGRKFGKKSADELVDDIVSGYKKAVKYHQKNRKKFIKEYSINNVLPGIINECDRKHMEHWTDEYTEAVLNCERLAHIRFATGMNEWNSRRLVEKLHGDLASKDADIEKLNTKINEMWSSKTFKLGRSICKPAKLLFKHEDNRQ